MATDAQLHADAPRFGVGSTRLPDVRKEMARLRQISLWQALSAAAEQRAGHTALIGADDAGTVSKISYGELLHRIRAFSAGLVETGVRRGDRILLWMTNSFEWVVAAAAAMRLGASLVPINTFLKPAEIKYFMEQSGARHLIMLDSFRQLNMVDQLEAIFPGIRAQNQPGFLFSPELPDLRNIVLFARSGGALACAHDFLELERNPSAEALAAADHMASMVGGSDIGMVKYTSGSTAFPKGALLEQGGIVANGILHTRRMELGGNDIFFSMMPFFHAGGSIFGMMTMLLNGGTLMFTEAFNPDLAADLMFDEKATVQLTLLANEIMLAADKKGYVFESIRVAGWPDELSKRLMPNAEHALAIFGQTESYGGAAVSSNPDPAKSGFSPKPIEGLECRIVDPETGADLPPGVPGEAWLRGNVARGYWNKPEETARVFDKDGWYHTEDLCSLDQEGRLTYHGRLKLMLKIGGENVSIEEIERKVEAHEAVLHCGVVGIPDPRKIEAPCLFVQLVEGIAFSAEDLCNWLKPQIAHFKMPREVLFLEDMPLLGNGKVDRLNLKERAMSLFA